MNSSLNQIKNFATSHGFEAYTVTDNFEPSHSRVVIEVRDSAGTVFAEVARTMQQARTVMGY